MRIVLSLFTSLVVLALAAPGVCANDTKPSPGTSLDFVGLGWTKTITVVGFKGCDFSVDAQSLDESIATVTFDAKTLAKKHKIVVEGVGYGTTQVHIETAGESQFCNAFEFDFPITVVFDEKAFLKDGKKLLSSAKKDAKSVVSDGFSLYCDDLGEIAAAVKEGADLNDAYFAAAEALGVFQDDLGQTLDDLYDQTWDDLWSGNAQQIASDADILSFYPGGCGEWDKFVGALTSIEDKLQSASYKKFKAFVKLLAKAAKGDDDELLLVAEFPEVLVLLALDEPVLLPGADPEAALPAAPPKPLAKTWTSAGRLRSSETSKLEVGGVADPGAGDVTVTITGAGGFTTNVDATVGDDCTFKAPFGDLAPGAYTVTLTQGDNGPVAFAVAVP